MFLLAEGKQNATFSLDFTQPGKSLLEAPCTTNNGRTPRTAGILRTHPLCRMSEAFLGQLRVISRSPFEFKIMPGFGVPTENKMNSSVLAAGGTAST